MEGVAGYQMCANEKFCSNNCITMRLTADARVVCDSRCVSVSACACIGKQGMLVDCCCISAHTVAKRVRHFLLSDLSAGSWPPRSGTCLEKEASLFWEEEEEEEEEVRLSDDLQGLRSEA
ncbi:hypothetical protein DPX16_7416 [Anabarilius grahami]|uniref:Uncharacterized protein n=1 Tax=Anabarilius grahami TaxID=495550 RepID=A0A3N0Z2I7_ANAGA|nr:hypothetical protein DPX16_7416 [Anabarilius grahami]